MKRIRVIFLALIVMPFFELYSMQTDTTTGSMNDSIKIGMERDSHRAAPDLFTDDTLIAAPDTINKNIGVTAAGIDDTVRIGEKSYRERSSRYLLSERKFDVPWQDEQINLDKFVFRYNRVESIFLGLGREKKFYWDGTKRWNAYGSIGWGIRSHTWRGNLGLVRQFAVLTDGGSDIVELGADIYTLTDTKDQWIISLHENTASAFLIHEDFRNYFERRGGTMHAALYMKRKNLKTEIRLSYLIDTYESLTNNVDWALFGGHKTFRANPEIDPGNMRSMKILGGVSTVSNTSSGPQGWSIYASAEYAKRIWNSKFEFDQYIIDLRRFLKLDRYENINVRVRAGSSDGVLPLQKLYELGGIGTLNAFPYKSETGNRMLLVNMELVVRGNILDDINFWPLWLLSNVNLMFLSDAGFTRNVPSNTSATGGFGDIKWNEFKHDFGIALSDRKGSIRLGFAWRTDRAAPVQLIIRFNRPF